MQADEQVIDRTGWVDGPWATEPDRVDWEHAGLPCLARRNRVGVWCGYAAVPPGHPLHGQTYGDLDLSAHGGLTYSDRCRGHICHVPKPGEPDDVWWFGFDCGHAGDFSPGLNATISNLDATLGQSSYDHAAAVAAHDWLVEVYRTLDYVQAEVNGLAEQLAAAR